jgi:hypothetical protein
MQEPTLNGKLKELGFFPAGICMQDFAALLRKQYDDYGELSAALISEWISGLPIKGAARSAPSWRDPVNMSVLDLNAMPTLITSKMS